MAGRPAIVPEITGRAWITGMGQYLLDPRTRSPRASACERVARRRCRDRRRGCRRGSWRVRGVDVTLLDRGEVSGGTTGLGEGNVLLLRQGRGAGARARAARACALFEELEERMPARRRIRRKGALIVHPTRRPGRREPARLERLRVAGGRAARRGRRAGGGAGAHRRAARRDLVPRRPAVRPAPDRPRAGARRRRRPAPSVRRDCDGRARSGPARRAHAAAGGSRATPSSSPPGRGAPRSPRAPGSTCPLEPRKGQLVQLAAPRARAWSPQGRRRLLPRVGDERPTPGWRSPRWSRRPGRATCSSAPRRERRGFDTQRRRGGERGDGRRARRGSFAELAALPVDGGLGRACGPGCPTTSRRSGQPRRAGALARDRARGRGRRRSGRSPAASSRSATAARSRSWTPSPFDPDRFAAVVRLALGNPAVAGRRDDQLVRVAARALGGERGDGARDVLLAGALFRRRPAQALLGLGRRDRRVDDEERDVDPLRAPLLRRGVRERAGRGGAGGPGRGRASPARAEPPVTWISVPPPAARSALPPSERKTKACSRDGGAPAAEAGERSPPRAGRRRTARRPAAGARR